jgi:hypothetical protein
MCYPLSLDMSDPHAKSAYVVLARHLEYERRGEGGKEARSILALENLIDNTRENGTIIEVVSKCLPTDCLSVD